MNRFAIITLLILLPCASLAGPATWTLQGVASYAESLADEVASSVGDASSIGGREVSTATPSDGQALLWDDDASTWEPGEISVVPDGNTTASALIWNPFVATWSAEELIPVDALASETLQQVSRSLSGEIRYRSESEGYLNFITSMSSSLVTISEDDDVLCVSTISYDLNQRIGVLSFDPATSTMSSGTAYAAVSNMIDGDSGTYCTINEAGMIYVDPDRSAVYEPTYYVAADYISEWNEIFLPYASVAKTSVTPDKRWHITGFSFLVASTSTPAPISADIYVYDRNDPTGSPIFVDSVDFDDLDPGEWWTSDGILDVKGAARVCVLFWPNWPIGSTTIDISEFRLIGADTNDDTWVSFVPPASFTTTTPTIQTQTASPTTPSNGTFWNDPAAGIKIYDQHGSWSTLLTDYPAWQDLRVSLLSTKLSGSNEPGLTVVRTNGGGSQGVLTYAFDKDSEEELYTSVQLPRDCYKTVVEPHLHWMPSGTGAGTVTWCIEYSLTNHLATQPAVTTIATCSQSTNEIDRQHLIADFPAIDISGAKDSAILLFRVYRAAANASDTYDADAFATDFDLHYQVRNKGSDDEYGDND